MTAATQLGGWAAGPRSRGGPGSPKAEPGPLGTSVPQPGSPSGPPDTPRSLVSHPSYSPSPRKAGRCTQNARPPGGPSLGHVVDGDTLPPGSGAGTEKLSYTSGSTKRVYSATNHVEKQQTPTPAPLLPQRSAAWRKPRFKSRLRLSLTPTLHQLHEFGQMQTC